MNEVTTTTATRLVRERPPMKPYKYGGDQEWTPNNKGRQADPVTEPADDVQV
jgi:hypothetical protein